jgi:PPOX class probable F420-dependent enzyme
MVDPRPVEVLAAHRHVRLTTFRRDGTAVGTTVWLVRDGDDLLVTTHASTGKVKRLRHTSRVLLAPSDSRGRVRPGAPEVEATARVVEDREEVARLRDLVAARYGLAFRVAVLLHRLRRVSPDAEVEIRITPR